MQFRRRHVGCSCGEFPWVKYFVAAGGDSDAMRIVLLRTIGDDDFRVRRRLIFRYVRYVLRFHHKNCVRSFRARFVVALTHATKVFSKSCHPNVRSSRIVHQFGIACDVFVCDGVYHCKAIKGNVTSCVAFAEMEWYEGLWCGDRVVYDEEVYCFLADETNVAEVRKRVGIELRRLTCCRGHLRR